jgi:hypothetical protein
VKKASSRAAWSISRSGDTAVPASGWGIEGSWAGHQVSGGLPL